MITGEEEAWMDGFYVARSETNEAHTDFRPPSKNPEKLMNIPDNNLVEIFSLRSVESRAFKIPNVI